MKRIFDLAMATVGIAVLGPLLIWVAWKIKAEDGGSVFYRGVRVGLHGKPFRIYKFRSMMVDADKIGPSSTASDDARITRIGRWIRMHKLDELPQLMNVLAGDMSFVGPRPEVKKFTDMYTAQEKAILTVRPGITDWASIWNSDEAALLAGADDPDKTYLELIRPEKLRLQLKYVRERSFMVDIRIILLTLLKLCKISRRHKQGKY